MANAGIKREDTLLAGEQLKCQQLKANDSGFGDMMECSDASSASGESLITKDMVKEEEQLLNAQAKEDKQEKKEARDEFEQVVESQRLARLHHLLSQSSLYTEFLHTRMEQQKNEREQLAAKKAKRAKAKKGKPGKKSKKRKNDDYQISDYIAEDDVSSKRRKTDEEKESNEEIVEHVTRADGTVVPVDQPELFSGGVLRDYQMRGVNWLKALYENGLNGILADEMGLGKTIQCIGFFAHLYAMQVKGPFLVVGPLSTLSNWYREFQRFTPDIPVVLYHGSKQDRAEMRRGIMQPDEKLGANQTVITSYQIAMNDRVHLANLPWKYIVVDEGHRLKNLNCKLIRELKQYQSANRLLLTGTPLQNNLSELWSLLNFLLPDIFNDLSSFQRWFDFTDLTGDSGRIIAEEQEQQILTKLHQILQPFLLRRLKTDAVKSIPPKKELVVYAGMTEKQRDYYQKIIDKTLMNELQQKNAKDSLVLPNGATRSAKLTSKDYTGDGEGLGQGTVWVDKIETEIDDFDADINISMGNCLMHLRKATNHPYLIKYPLTLDGQYRIDEDLVQASGKMVLLDQMLPELIRRKHKVLIFSQMVRMLDILQDYCWLRDINFARLDGSIKHEDRIQAIDDFQGNADVSVMLISTRAGGLGVNLMAGDTVILYDSDWNPQCDLQAMDRCHRIGQEKTVMVYRFVVANTVDEHMLNTAESKRKLEKMVIHKNKFKGEKKNETFHISTQELQKLLTESSSAKIVAGEALSQEELERILDRTRDTKDSVGTSFKVVEEAAEPMLLL